MAKFMFGPAVRSLPTLTSRIGAARVAGSTNHLRTDAEKGKFVRLVGESRYDVCSIGNEIEGTLFAVDAATSDGYTTGAVQTFAFGEMVTVTFDGLVATPGAGNLGVGDAVVVGTPLVVGTGFAASAIPAPKVCKAPVSLGALAFKWRVVSLGAAGTGAPGTTGVIQFVG